MKVYNHKSKNQAELKVKPRKEIAYELGISLTTFWRHLKKHEINLPPGLVYPNKQKEIYSIFRDETK